MRLCLVKSEWTFGPTPAYASLSRPLSSADDPTVDAAAVTALWRGRHAQREGADIVAAKEAELKAEIELLKNGVMKTIFDDLYENAVMPVAKLVKETGAWRGHALATAKGSLLN